MKMGFRSISCMKYVSKYLSISNPLLIMIICSHLGLGPPDGARLDGAGLIEPGEDLGHAAV